MPPKGYISLTLPERVYEAAVEQTKKERERTGKYISISEYICNLILKKCGETLREM